MKLPGTLATLLLAPLALAACGSDSTSPPAQLTDGERAVLVSAFARLADSLTVLGAGNMASAVDNLSIVLGSGADVTPVSVTTSDGTTTYRALAFRASEPDTTPGGQPFTFSGLLAWRDTTEVVFSMLLGEGTASFPGASAGGTPGPGDAFAWGGVYVAPRAVWEATTGSTTIARRSSGGACAHNPLAEQVGIPSTCTYSTFDAGLAINAGEPESGSTSANRAVGSVTVRIDPVSVSGATFEATAARARRMGAAPRLAAPALIAPRSQR